MRRKTRSIRDEKILANELYVWLPQLIIIMNHVHCPSHSFPLLAHIYYVSPMKRDNTNNTKEWFEEKHREKLEEFTRVIIEANNISQ